MLSNKIWPIIGLSITNFCIKVSKHHASVVLWLGVLIWLVKGHRFHPFGLVGMTNIAC